MPLMCDMNLEYCRLCQRTPGSVPIIHDDTFIDQVFECTKIKINDGHMNLFPKTVCCLCKMRIEKFFLYVQEVRAVDQKLHSQFWNQIHSETNSHNELLLEQTERETYKCPVCPTTVSQYQSLQAHKHSHSSLYCRVCTKVFDDVLSCEAHTCEKVEKECAETRQDEVPVKNENNCDVNSEDELKLYDVLSCEAHTCEKVEKECAETKQDEVPVKNENDFDVNSEDELKLSDVIEGSGLREECLEVKFATDEESGSELKDEHTCSVDGDVSPSDQLKSRKCNLKAAARKTKRSKAYSCNICGEEFLRTTHLRTHQKLHGNSFPCSISNCRKVCTSAYSLETHIMRHKGKMPFLCSTCGKGLTTKSSLKCHEKIHAKIKEYVCKECNVSFAIRNTLRAHQKKEHEGVRYYCSKCARAFTSKGSLERHELVHGGVKNFACDACASKFYTNKELLNHQRYHKGLRLFKCDECYKTFYERHHLTIHRRFHTGEKPYPCKVAGCGKSFVDSQSLSQHRKSRHASAE